MKIMNEFLIIGITGPTGAGKTTVCQKLASDGYPIVDADKVAKRVINSSIKCRTELASYFGPDILDDKNKLNNIALAQKAFVSSENLNMLNKITHKDIISEIKSEIDKYKLNGYKIIILDIPLLFETNLDSVCTNTIAIVADEKIRRKRLLKRDNISKGLINLRMSVQNKDEFYKSKADYILLNNGEIKMLYQKIYKILLDLIGENNEIKI